MYFNTLIAAQILAFASIVLAAPAQGLDKRITKQKCTVTAVEPPPKQLVCQTEGVLKDPHNVIMGRETAKNPDACLASCKELSACIAFGYAEALGTCYFYGEAIKSQEFSASKTGVEYSNKNCFIEHCTGDVFTSSTVVVTKTVKKTSKKPESTKVPKTSEKTESTKVPKTSEKPESTKEPKTSEKESKTTSDKVKTKSEKSKTSEASTKGHGTTVATVTIPVVLPTGPALSTIFDTELLTLKNGHVSTEIIPIKTITITLPEPSTLKTSTKLGKDTTTVPKTMTEKSKTTEVETRTKTSKVVTSQLPQSTATISLPPTSLSTQPVSISFSTQPVSISSSVVSSRDPIAPISASSTSVAISVSIPVSASASASASASIPASVSNPAASSFSSSSSSVDASTSLSAPTSAGDATITLPTVSLPTFTIVAPTDPLEPITSILGGVTSIIPTSILPTNLPVSSILTDVTSILGGITSVLPTSILPTDLPLSTIVSDATSLLGSITGILPTSVLPTDLPISTTLPDATSILSGVPTDIPTSIISSVLLTITAVVSDVTSLLAPVTSAPVTLPITEPIAVSESLSLSVSGVISTGVGVGATATLGGSGGLLSATVSVGLPVASVTVPVHLPL